MGETLNPSDRGQSTSVIEANWQRKAEILKAFTDPKTTLEEVGHRFNISKGTVWNTLNRVYNNLLAILKTNLIFHESCSNFITLTSLMREAEINSMQIMYIMFDNAASGLESRMVLKMNRLYPYRLLQSVPR
jgi:hypothetical protein